MSNTKKRTERYNRPGFKVIVAVLREAGRPLRGREIVELAGSRLPSKALDPYLCVVRDLALDIKEYGKRSTVVRVERGLFTLRELLGTGVRVITRKSKGPITVDGGAGGAP